MKNDLIAKKAVLLVNLGTPTAPTPKAVRRFLREFLSDKRVVDVPQIIWQPLLNGVILPLRSRESARKYQKIWTKSGSPLMNYSLKIENLVGQQFDGDVLVKCAMRYGGPSIKDVLNSLQGHVIKELIILPMYPQYSATTTASVCDAVFKELSQWHFVPEIKFINHYSDHPMYINALANSIVGHHEKSGKPDKLLMSFHGIPKQFFEAGDPYYCYCHKTARLVAEQCGLKDEEWQMVFQSRFGRKDWLEPYCDKTLESLAKEGCKKVDIICPGFSVDCLETLEEIAITNKQLFLNAGGEEFSYIPALNDSRAQVELVCDLIEGPY